MHFQAYLEDNLNSNSNNKLKNLDKVSRILSVLRIYLAKASRTSFLVLSKALEASWVDLEMTSPLVTTTALSLVVVTSILTTLNQISVRTLGLSTMVKVTTSQISGKEYRETCSNASILLKAKTKSHNVNQLTRK